MIQKLIIAAVSTAVCLASAAPAVACSTFCLDAASGAVFGKNYDWDVPDGMAIVNKRNVTKTGLTAENPARWTSKFASELRESRALDFEVRKRHLQPVRQGDAVRRYERSRPGH
jgi:penicillin V acylase-like amidase (Ntn superfamily)